MIDFIIGDIVNIQEDYVVIQNNGIGYKVFTSKNSIMNLELGKKEQMLYTQLHMREDGMFLYGFTREEEIQMFNMLLRVSKIGPKIGIGVLSALTPNQIKIAILNKDIKTLCLAPGIGKKTAERIILELKDKIDSNGLVEEETPINIQVNESDEAIDALVSLGYSRFEVEKALNSINIDGLNIEGIIREGLKKLSQG